MIFENESRCERWLHLSQIWKVNELFQRTTLGPLSYSSSNFLCLRYWNVSKLECKNGNQDNLGSFRKAKCVLRTGMRKWIFLCYAIPRHLKGIYLLLPTRGRKSLTRKKNEPVIHTIVGAPSTISACGFVKESHIIVGKKKSMKPVWLVPALPIAELVLLEPLRWD